MKEYLKNICNAMKKNIFIYSIICLSFFSCTNEQTESLVESTYKLEANIENTNINSRVGFENITGNFFWTKNDEIGVTTTSSSTTFQKMTLSSGAGEDKGVFEGTISGTPDGYAVYPFIAENNHTITNGGELSYNLPQTYTYSSLDKDYGLKNGNSFNPPMWSEIGDKLSFKHLGGVICVLVNGLPIGNNLEFTLTTSNKITGSFTVDLATTKPALQTTASQTENIVTINFSNANDNEIGVFYIPVPTGTYANITAQIMHGNNLIASKEWTNQIVGLGTLKKGIITNTSTMKKLFSYGEKTQHIFEYNNRGELIKDYRSYESDKPTSYTWDKNRIKEDDGYETCYYILNNTLIEKYVDANGNIKRTYEYNASNKLISISNSEGEKSIEITWDGDKMISYTRSYGEMFYTYTYDENTKTTGWCPLYDDELWDELSEFHWANPHLFGMLSHHLPIKIIEGNNETRFSYELNNEGYVNKVYVEKSSVSNPEEISSSKTFTYTWQ